MTVEHHVINQKTRRSRTGDQDEAEYGAPDGRHEVAAAAVPTALRLSAANSGAFMKPTTR